MPTSPATNRSLTLSADNTCHRRLAPPTTSRRVCRKPSSQVKTRSSTMSLARLNFSVCTVPSSSSEASTDCFLHAEPNLDPCRGDTALQQRAVGRLRLVSFHGRRYTIRSLQGEKTPFALRLF